MSPFPNRATLPVLLVLLVVGAGCAAPVGPGPDDPSVDVPADATCASAPTDPSYPYAQEARADDFPMAVGVPPLSDQPSGDNVSVPTEGGSTDVDLNRTYARTRHLLGSDEPPPTVTVRGGARPATPYVPRVHERPFHDLLGVATVRPVGGYPGGSTSVSITLYTMGQPAPAVESALVHEFTHHVQFEEDLAYLPPRSSSDGRMVWAAIMEGGATWTATRYADRYLPNATPQDEVFAARYTDGNPGARFVWAPYVFGDRYLDRTLDSPRSYADVFERDVATTEQLLHPEEKGDEAPRPLRLCVAGEEWEPIPTDERGSLSQTKGNDTMGELLTRVTLRAEVSRSAAATAAAGWGNDRLRVVDTGNGTLLAWALRFDDAGESAEFRDALGTFVQRRRAAGQHLRTVTVAPETTVVLAADAPSTLAGVSARGENGTVVVSD